MCFKQSLGYRYFGSFYGPDILTSSNICPQAPFRPLCVPGLQSPRGLRQAAGFSRQHHNTCQFVGHARGFAIPFFEGCPREIKGRIAGHIGPQRPSDWLHIHGSLPWQYRSPTKISSKR